MKLLRGDRPLSVWSRSIAGLRCWARVDGFSTCLAHAAAGTMLPMTTRKEELDTYVRRQSAQDLAAVLLELAEANPQVRQRLVRMQLSDEPDRLAATFRKTLNGWRRQSRFLDYRASLEWATELDAWLGQLDRELLPRDPMAVVSLAESFIESDADFFERADDSSGCIGDAMRAACRLWLQAAARCEVPAGMWPSRLLGLFAGDQYGARESLLAHADLLLPEPQLRVMVAEIERDLDRSPTPSDPDARPAHGVRSSLTALTLLSRALRDPDVHVRATLRRSPRPNSMQKQDFVLQYLEVGRPVDALPWLEDVSDWHEHTRLRLLAEVLKRLGETERSAPMQQKVFETTLAIEDFRTWLDHLEPHANAGAVERARALALDHDDPVTAARLLLEIEHDEDAEQVLVAEPARIRGEDYTWLVPLAAALQSHERWRGATAVYRALLNAILAKAYAPAYGHGARYWHHLHAIAEQSPSLLPLQAHDEYIAAIRQKNARKVAFWAQVNKGSAAAEGTKGDDVADDD
jgi:hypothetical protein